VCEDDDGNFVLHGATSWGYGCADASYPGVWARVHFVRSWVDSLITGTPTPSTTPAPPPQDVGSQLALLQDQHQTQLLKLNTLQTLVEALQSQMSTISSLLNSTSQNH